MVLAGRRVGVDAAGMVRIGPAEMSEGDGILEDVSARMRSPVLVGRSEELAILDAALERARTGGPWKESDEGRDECRYSQKRRA